MSREQAIKLLRRLYQYGEEGLTIDANIAREIEEMIELLESEPDLKLRMGDVRTPLSELWVCGSCKWYGTSEECDGGLNCQECEDEDMMRMDSIVDTMHVCGNDDEIDRLKDENEAIKSLEDNCWDLRCIDIPTGGGDYDIDWIVVEHYQQEPKERIIGRGKTPFEAIEQALKGEK